MSNILSKLLSKQRVKKAIGPAVGAGARMAAPHVRTALSGAGKALGGTGKHALTTAGTVAGTGIGLAAAKKFNEKTHLDPTSSVQKIAPAIIPAIGMAARAIKPAMGAIGKVAKHPASVGATAGGVAGSMSSGTQKQSDPPHGRMSPQIGLEVGGAKYNEAVGSGAKTVKPVTKQSPPNPEVASRMWQRGLIWSPERHRWIKRPDVSSVDEPKADTSYDGNIIVIPKEKSYWGSGASLGEAEKASKKLASMLEFKFPGSRVIFGNNPIIQGPASNEIDSWIDRNWKKAVSRRVGRSGALDKSNNYSDKEKEKREKDKKFWNQKNKEFLQRHPEKKFN